MTDTPRERYNRDLKFRMLVDTNRKLIEGCEFTGTEIREAAMLALIMYEETHGRLHRIIDMTGRGTLARTESEP